MAGARGRPVPGPTAGDPKAGPELGTQATDSPAESAPLSEWARGRWLLPGFSIFWEISSSTGSSFNVLPVTNLL